MAEATATQNDSSDVEDDQQGTDLHTAKPLRKGKLFFQVAMCKISKIAEASVINFILLNQKFLHP